MFRVCKVSSESKAQQNIIWANPLLAESLVLDGKQYSVMYDKDIPHNCLGINSAIRKTHNLKVGDIVPFNA